jgi:hypothetical protein
LSDLSSAESKEDDQGTKARVFESSVGARLQSLFRTVETHRRIVGFSGITWNVDFLVNSNFVVEATTQRRLETKINSTFIRYADIFRKHPEMKGALVVEKVHVLLHHARGKKYFPTSEYRTFLAFGYPLVSIEDVQRLVSFHEGSSAASEVSSRPADFNPRSFLNDKEILGARITNLLKAGPLTKGDIAKLTGRTRDTISEAIKLLPQVKKVSIYYGLDEDQIYRTLLIKGGGGPIQGPLVRRWLRESFLERIRIHGSYKTVAFAAEMGLGQTSLGHFIHDLSEEGVISRAGKGEWELGGSQRSLC